MQVGDGVAVWFDCWPKLQGRYPDKDWLYGAGYEIVLPPQDGLTSIVGSYSGDEAKFLRDVTVKRKMNGVDYVPFGLVKRPTGITEDFNGPNVRIFAPIANFVEMWSTFTKTCAESS